MFTKNDLQAIGDTVNKQMDRRLTAFGKVVDEKIINDLGDFFEQILAPYLDKRFGEHDKRFDEMEERFDGIDLKLEKIDDRLDKHDVLLSEQKKAHLIS